MIRAGSFAGHESDLLDSSDSLKNHGADQEVNGMFDVGAETLALPLEERMKFEQGDSGQSFGSVIDMAHKRILSLSYLDF